MVSGEGDKIAVFVSEDDRLLEEVVDDVMLVVSDRSELEGICSAKFHEIGHDEDQLLELLDSKGISKGICLGYQRLFSGSFLEQVTCEMYNLHPSLLPAFKGLNVYSKVLERGVRISGATLHCVSEEMDEGEIVDQVSYHVPEDVSSHGELKGFAKKFELELFRRNFLEK